MTVPLSLSLPLLLLTWTVQLSTMHSTVYATAATTVDEKEQLEYGVDCSFPMHYNLVSDNYAWLPHNTDPSLPTPPEYQGMPVTPLPDRKQFYDDYVKGCEDNAGNERCCASYEQDRVDMSLAQPAGMNVSETTTTTITTTTTTVNLMPGWVSRGQLNTGIVT